MMGEKGLYFSQAEFLVLLELAGTGKCSLLHSGEEPDSETLRQALAGLFRRGLIQQGKKGFVLTQKGEPFVHIRQAPFAVTVSWERPDRGRAVCYTEENTLWLVELADVVLGRQYRLRELSRQELVSWLTETCLLERSILTERDVAELGRLVSDLLEEPLGETLLSLEKCWNGGKTVVSYDLIRCRGERLLRCRGPEGCQTVIYTKEALPQILARCFGKGNYDCC